MLNGGYTKRRDPTDTSFIQLSITDCVNGSHISPTWRFSPMGGSSYQKMVPYFAILLRRNNLVCNDSFTDSEKSEVMLKLKQKPQRIRTDISMSAYCIHQ